MQKSVFMASAASMHQHTATSGGGGGGGASRPASSSSGALVSPSNSVANPDSLHHRMDQFLSNMRHHQQQQQQQQQQMVGEDEGSPPESYHHHLHHHHQHHHHNNMEGGATSGSNSGEEDEREVGENGKRLGGIINGLASKKRRKQSKPIRLGANEGGPEPGEVGNHNPDERRYSTEEEYEDGERRNDGPLNLSAEKEGDRPSLRVLGAELMQNPATSESGDKGHLPPGLTSSLYQGMLPFGLPPFPFPFPNPPTSSTPTSGSGKLSSMGGASPMNSGGRSQIFNPEAYCELCNKEFCNKYFLKTHKANKHGIYTEGPGVSKSPGPVSLPPSSGNSITPPSNSLSHPHHPHPHHRSDSTEGQGGPPTPNSQGGSPFSGAFIAANMGSLRPPFMPLSPGASPSPTSSHPGKAESGQLGSGQNHRENGTNGDRLSTRDETSPRSSVSNKLDMMSPKGEELRMEERLRQERESPRTPLGGLPSHLSNFNPLMFGGIPSLESFRKEEDMRNKEQGQINIPNITNMTNIQGKAGKASFNADKLRQMGVINADAFCEICCKEFCNKYFLRVHKLKKHGICSPDLPPEKVQKILNQMAKEAGKTGNPPPPIIRPPSSLANGSSASLDKLSGSNSGMPLAPTGMSHIRPSSHGSSSSMLPLPPLEPLLPQALKDFTTSMSKSSEDKHNNKEESSNDREIIRVRDDSEDGNSKEQPMNFERSEGERDTSESHRSTPNSSQQPSEDLQRLQSMIMELNSSKNKDAISANSGNQSTLCKICNKDMENKYFLRAHMMNEHGVLHMEDSHRKKLSGDPQKDGDMDFEKAMMPFGFMNGMDQSELAAKFLQQMQKGLGSNLPLDTDELSFLERVKSELAGSPKRMDRDPNRKPASLSRSYCEICKKELCNKYFMKTHMMKMHGINIDASNGAGVSCHLCKKELCSKYFLKVHLQNTHGINEDGTPTSTGMKENGNGGLFHGLFPPPPPPDMLGLSGSPEKDRYFSRLLGEQSEISRERLKELERQKQMLGNSTEGSNHTCSLCGKDFPEIVALQVHIIKSHGAFPPDSGVFGSPTKAKRDNEDSQESQKEEKLSPKDEQQVNRIHEEDRREKTKDDEEDEEEEDHHHEGMKERNERSLPKNNVSGGVTLSSPLDGLSPGDAAKQFPHIEMLQRHMLSQQFPGLISPLLSGFPGFPGNGGGLHFPNPLQQFLGGSGKEKDDLKSSAEKPLRESSSSPNKKSTRRKSFKCSKCRQKFAKREQCLRHIQDTHAMRPRRQLHFSPNKKSRSSTLRTQQRSQYVRQLMQLLKVPTSRGTPQSPLGGSTGEHIMQPFLLKAPASPDVKEDESSSLNLSNENLSTATSEDIHINFVPSLVYLPVAKRVSQPLTVAFNLTPA